MNDAASGRLHLLMSGGADALDLCLEQLDDGDAVLLVDAGVNVIAGAGLTALESKARRVYALETDVRARGLSAPPGVTLIGDTEWVRLVHAHSKSLSWT